MTESQLNGNNRNMAAMPEEEEIDLWELAMRFWAKRMFVIKVTAVFFVLGLLVAFTSTKKYTAGVDIVPQVTSKGGASSVASLASMFGVNLGDLSATGESLSPKLYPKLLENVAFQKEIIYTEFSFSEVPEKMTLVDYLNDEELNRPGILGYVRKYTIGLPSVIIKAIRGEDEKEVKDVVQDGKVYRLTKEERKAIAFIKEHIQMTVNDKDGYISINVETEQPQFSADLAYRIQELIQKYITDLRIEKVKSNYDFVTARYYEAKEEYEKVQRKYAEFTDANRNLSSAVMQAEGIKLKNDYDLASAIYNEMAKQRLQSGIKVKEDTPVFSVLKPVVVPTVPSKPNRMMTVVVFIFLGGILGCGGVLGADFLKNKGIDFKWLQNWN